VRAPCHRAGARSKGRAQPSRGDRKPADPNARSRIVVAGLVLAATVEGALTGLRPRQRTPGVTWPLYPSLR